MSRVLVLSGVSGCGKSSTVEAVCEELGIRVRHWSEDDWLGSHLNSDSSTMVS